MRLFIAINLPPEIKETVRNVQADIAAQVSPKAVAWVRREQCHLTLNFLGDVQIESVAPLADLLRNVGGEFTPFRVAACGVGVFPNKQRPRVIWAGVRSHGDELERLQQATTTATAQMCRLPDDKKFVGHITIGRCKDSSRSDNRKIAEIVESQAAAALGAWDVSSFELMRSELSPNGAIHSVHESFRFGKV
jgi:2'-5' RNA ligase